MICCLFYINWTWKSVVTDPGKINKDGKRDYLPRQGSRRSRVAVAGVRLVERMYRLIAMNNTIAVIVRNAKRKRQEFSNKHR